MYLFHEKKIIEVLYEKTREWHISPTEGITFEVGGNQLVNRIVDLHFNNFVLWLKEEETRNRNKSLEEIGKIKIEIDVLNYKRNEIIGEIDELLLKEIKYPITQDWSNEKYYLNSETLGQILDRLSILLLKKFFTEFFIKTATEDKLKDLNKDRLIRLNNQIEYASLCFNKYFSALKNGTGYMLNYKQTKLYQRSHYSK